MNQNDRRIWKENIIGALLTLLVAIAGYVAKSLAELNENVAVVISRLAYHEKELEKHDKEIANLRERSK